MARFFDASAPDVELTLAPVVRTPSGEILIDSSTQFLASSRTLENADNNNFEVPGVFGTTKLLAVRAIFNAPSVPSSSAAAIVQTVANAASQLSACSGGQLSIASAGVIDVTVEKQIVDKPYELEAEVLATMQKIGQIPDHTHLMLCMPSGLTGWTAYGYVLTHIRLNKGGRRCEQRGAAVEQKRSKCGAQTHA